MVRGAYTVTPKARRVRKIIPRVVLRVRGLVLLRSGSSMFIFLARVPSQQDHFAQQIRGRNFVSCFIRFCAFFFFCFVSQIVISLWSGKQFYKERKGSFLQYLLKNILRQPNSFFLLLLRRCVEINYYAEWPVSLLRIGSS